MKKPTHRINLNLELETLEVIDAFAQLTDRSRTYVIEALLQPSLPALRELLAMPEKLTAMNDVDRLAALAKLAQAEEKLTGIHRSMPAHLEGLTK